VAIFINFILFQIGWFACVLGGVHGQPWAGTVVALAIVALHLARAANPAAEFKLVLVVALIGGAWDSALVALGWIVYPSGTLITNTAPHWIVAMWMLFATTLNISLRWLKHRGFLAILLGAVAGPFAYYAGEMLGALQFTDWLTAIAAQGIGWGMLLPLLVMLSNRYDGIATARRLRVVNV
jgi:hypothetical protein